MKLGVHGTVQVYSFLQPSRTVGVIQRFNTEKGGEMDEVTETVETDSQCPRLFSVHSVLNLWGISEQGHCVR